MNPPHNDMELKNDLCKRIYLPVWKYFIKVILPANWLHLIFTDLILCANITIPMHIWWCVNNHWLCLLRLSRAHVSSQRRWPCCGGSERHCCLLAVASGKEVRSLYCDSIDPPQLLSRSGDDKSVQSLKWHMSKVRSCCHRRRRDCQSLCIWMKSIWCNTVENGMLRFPIKKWIGVFEITSIVIVILLHGLWSC